MRQRSSAPVLPGLIVTGARHVSSVRAPAQSSIQPGCSSRFRPAGTTTCCVPSNTSARSGMCRTRGWTKRSICSDPSSSPMAPGCWRTRIPARSTLRSRTATVGPAGGTRCGRCVSSAGTSSPLPEQRSRFAPSSASLPLLRRYQ